MLWLPTAGPAERKRWLLFWFLSKVLTVAVGLFNIWFAVSDQQEAASAALAQYAAAGAVATNITSSTYAFDVVLLVNVLLLVSALLDWLILQVLWLLFYGCVIVTASFKFFANGRLPWIPGISPSASRFVLETVGIRKADAAFVGLTLVVFEFALIFLLIAAVSLRQIKVASMSSLSSGTFGTGLVLPFYSARRDPLDNFRTSQPDLPPTYSDLAPSEGPTRDAEQPPPKYEEAAAGNDSVPVIVVSGGDRIKQGGSLTPPEWPRP